MSTKDKRRKTLFIIINLAMAAIAVFFITLMGYLNYKTSAIEVKEQVITRIEGDTVDVMETALGFGKRIDNYYGTDEIFASFRKQTERTLPFIIDTKGKLLYIDSVYGENEISRIEKFLDSVEFTVALNRGLGDETFKLGSEGDRAIFYPIHQDDEIEGYFVSIYSKNGFNSDLANVRKVLALLALAVGLLLMIAIVIFIHIIENEAFRRRHPSLSKHAENLGVILLMSAAIIFLSVISIFVYRTDYRQRIVDATKASLYNIENNIGKVSEQGVDIRNVAGLEEYISTRIATLDTLRVVRVSERIAVVARTEEESDLITFVFHTRTDEGEESFMYLEAEISALAMNRQVKSIVLTLISTLIILLMFVFESTKFIELVSDDGSEDSKNTGGFSEKKVSISLRLTGFLVSTAEYMCVPYAAMMIRESGETLFGFSNGVTSALPLTMEGFAQMIGMLLLPKIFKKKNVRTTLLISSIVMILSNGVAFLSNAALTIVICRTVAGVAYAGFKQVSNYLITKGYNTDEGRSENISQDNAGLLAGATCGAGLGAILSANLGYSTNFLISAVFFWLYLTVALFALPWDMIKNRTDISDEESKPVSAAGIRRMIFSKEMLFFILAIGIPLNIGVMLCVTLIPAICQTNGISSVFLSYCYIANGIAGIYIGPALVAKAKKRFGLPLCIAFVFALTAISLFILHVPPIIVMLVVSSTVLGFLDGFGTPMVTDQFMELKVVRNEVDESTALIFSVVLSYILLTFAPMIAELLLLPGKGFFSPMMIGVIVYAVCAVLLIIFRLGKGKEKSGERA